jgi:TRAP-type mannitol/chloroaromatic compound transport system substrate-binding protein
MAVMVVIFCAFSILGYSQAFCQTTKVLKIEIPVPVTSVLYENFQMYAENVSKMTGGKIKIETLPAGSVVGAMEILDAASRGVLDGGHAWAGYWSGKNIAAGIIGGAPAGGAGMDHLDFYGWYYEGGGLALLQEFYDMVGANVVTLGPVAGVGPQALGWFKKPIKNLEEFKKLKYRVPGIAADVYKEMGVSVVNLAAGEILPAGERGVIDGAEWLTPADDLKLGFDSVWKYYITPAYHDYVPVWDIFINKDVWKKIPADQQEIMKAATAATALMHWTHHMKQNGEAMELMKKKGINVIKTPDDILQDFLEKWEIVANREAAKNPFVKKVLDSQRKYAALIRGYRLKMEAPYSFAAGYYDKIEKK